MFLSWGKHRETDAFVSSPTDSRTSCSAFWSSQKEHLTHLTTPKFSCTCAAKGQKALVWSQLVSEYISTLYKPTLNLGSFLSHFFYILTQFYLFFSNESLSAYYLLPESLIGHSKSLSWYFHFLAQVLPK